MTKRTRPPYDTARFRARKAVRETPPRAVYRIVVGETEASTYCGRTV